MPDVTVSIDGTAVDSLTARYDYAIGRTTTLSCRFQPSSVATNYRTRYQTIRDLYEYARKGETVRVGVQDDGTPWYRERVPSAAAVTTFLVDIDPAAGAEAVDAKNVWAVVLGGTDTTPANVYSRRMIDLDVFILAELSDYADKSAVEAALGSEVL